MHTTIWINDKNALTTEKAKLYIAALLHYKEQHGCRQDFWLRGAIIEVPSGMRSRAKRGGGIPLISRLEDLGSIMSSPAGYRVEHRP